MPLWLNVPFSMPSFSSPSKAAIIAGMLIFTFAPSLTAISAGMPFTFWSGLSIVHDSLLSLSFAMLNTMFSVACPTFSLPVQLPSSFCAAALSVASSATIRVNMVFIISVIC